MPSRCRRQRRGSPAPPGRFRSGGPVPILRRGAPRRRSAPCHPRKKRGDRRVDRRDGRSRGKVDSDCDGRCRVRTARPPDDSGGIGSRRAHHRGRCGASSEKTDADRVANTNGTWVPQGKAFSARKRRNSEKCQTLLIPRGSPGSVSVGRLAFRAGIPREERSNLGGPGHSVLLSVAPGVGRRHHADRRAGWQLKSDLGEGVPGSYAGGESL